MSDKVSIVAPGFDGAKVSFGRASTLWLWSSSGEKLKTRCAWMWDLDQQEKPWFRVLLPDNTPLKFTLDEPTKEVLDVFLDRFEAAMGKTPHETRMLAFPSATAKPPADPSPPPQALATPIELQLDADLRLSHEKEEEEVPRPFRTVETPPKRKRAKKEGKTSTVASLALADKLNKLGAKCTQKFDELRSIDLSKSPEVIQSELLRKIGSRTHMRELLLLRGSDLAGFGGDDLKRVLAMVGLCTLAERQAKPLPSKLTLDGKEFVCARLVELEAKHNELFAKLSSGLTAKNLGIPEFFVRLADKMECLPTAAHPLRFSGFKYIGLSDGQIRKIEDEFAQHPGKWEECFGKREHQRPNPGLVNIADLTDTAVQEMDPFWKGEFEHEPLKGLHSPQTVKELLEMKLRIMIFVFSASEGGQLKTLRSALWDLRTTSDEVSLQSFFESTLLERPGIELLFNALLVEKVFAKEPVVRCSREDMALRSRLVLAGRLFEVTKNERGWLKKSEHWNLPLDVAYARVPTTHKTMDFGEDDEVWDELGEDTF